MQQDIQNWRFSKPVLIGAARSSCRLNPQLRGEHNAAISKIPKTPLVFWAGVVALGCFTFYYSPKFFPHTDSRKYMDVEIEKPKKIQIKCNKGCYGIHVMSDPRLHALNRLEMIFIEDYIDTVESLSPNLQRLISHLRELDACVYHNHESLKADMEAFCNGVVQMDPSDRAERLRAIQARLEQCVALDEERALAAMAAKDVVKVHVIRANDNYSAFCEELALEEAKIERKRGAAEAAAQAQPVNVTSNETSPAKGTKRTRREEAAREVVSDAEPIRQSSVTAGTTPATRSGKAAVSSNNNVKSEEMPSSSTSSGRGKRGTNGGSNSQGNGASGASTSNSAATTGLSSSRSARANRGQSRRAAQQDDDMASSSNVSTAASNQQTSTARDSAQHRDNSNATSNGRASVVAGGGGSSTRGGSASARDTDAEDPPPQADDFDEEYCYCRKGTWVGDMVGCDDDQCQYEWFHLKCVGLDHPPDGEWICPDCSDRRKAAAEGSKSRRRRGSN